MSDQEIILHTGQYPAQYFTSNALSSRDVRFCSFVADQIEHDQHDPVRAMEMAGFPEPHTEEKAQIILDRPEIQRRIQAYITEKAELAEISADRVIKEYGRLAFANPKDLFKSDGTAKPFEELTEAQAAAIQSVDVIMNDDGAIIATRYKFHDKKPALDALAKHFDLLDGKGVKKTKAKSISELAEIAKSRAIKNAKR